jgi:hypothetical protein
MTSSSRRKPRTTAWNAGPETEWPARIAFTIGVLLLAGSAMSVAVADTAGADLPLPPLPPFESAAPTGVILDEPLVAEPLVDEPAVEIRLATADLIMVQTNRDEQAKTPGQAERSTTEKQGPQEQSDTQARKDKQDTDKRNARDKEAAKKACGEQSKDCREALQTLRDDDIKGIALDIRVGGRPGSDYPCECRLEGETFEPRRFATTMVTWKAAGNCHKPLYFEDWNLERYGHSHGALDPVLSAAHFFVTLPVLPYKMGVELPWECVYPLGYYRPGSCAPWTVPAVPISCRGLAVEAATVTGLVFLLP